LVVGINLLHTTITEFNAYATFICTSNAILSDAVVTVSDVYEALVSLDQNKVMGPDGISPKLLKYCTQSTYCLSLLVDHHKWLSPKSE